MTSAIDAGPDDDLDLNPDDEVPVALTREQTLSRLSLRELQLICKSPEYSLSAAGRTTELIARIVKFEEEGIIDGDPAVMDLKPGIAPTPVEPTVPAPAPQSPAPQSLAPAGAVVKPQKQKVGFFEATNTYRTEFPLGPRATIDDPTHFQFIQDTHVAATAAGFVSKGAPNTGWRVGFSVIRTDSGPMRSVIYEVFARATE